MIIFVADAFKEDYPGGAELTTESLIDACLLPVHKIKAHQLSYGAIEAFKDHHWVFGNFSNINDLLLLECAKKLNYSVLEYDYKFCKYRSAEKHIAADGRCDCPNSVRSRAIAIFLAKAANLWWMSQKQKDIYCKIYPFLEHPNSRVLSSIFSQTTLGKIENLYKNEKDDKWIILNSDSWIKGVPQAKKHAEENGLNYELVWGLSHDEFLEKMSRSKGIIFLPPGGDTCPRFIIEAKLLGCELVLNENVQHKEEEWFQGTREEIISYLSSRSLHFWRETEKHIPNIPQVEASTESSQKYKIIVPFYNAQQWLPKCIDSIQRQRHENFECILIDDMSTDKSYEVASSLTSEDARFNVIKNETKQYALGNIVKTIEDFCHDENEVIILMDGDDWFSSSKTLQRLNDVYEEEQCLLTYGSYCYSPTGQRGVEPSAYSEEVVQSNSFREDSWRASHLRSFKHKLWKNLDKKDLRDEEGQFYPMAYDQTIMLPLLELASERTKYIDDIMYVYNRGNPNNIDKTKAKQQYEIALEIRKKKRYERLP